MSHKKYRKETNCLNCGAVVEQKFCPECGQENLDTRENFFHIAGHFLSDYFHYDSKFFRSLVPLLIRPGFLTRQYWEGKRVNYIHPLRLFFFITILFMLSVSYFYEHFKKEVREAVISTDDAPGKRPFINFSIPAKNSDEAVRIRNNAYADVDTYLHSLKYISFLLLPFYALVFKLLYIRRKGFYVDHLVYMLHVQSFVYLFISIILVMPFLLPVPLVVLKWLTLSAIVIYIGASLRYLYKQSWLKTVIKSVVATLVLINTVLMLLALMIFLNAIF